jgi:hypothetical protein
MSKTLSPLNARIDSELFHRFKRHVIKCQAKGIDKSQEQLVERAISELLEREEKEPCPVCLNIPKERNEIHKFCHECGRKLY